jgi:hypothetical protein
MASDQPSARWTVGTRGFGSLAGSVLMESFQNELIS